MPCTTLGWGQSWARFHSIAQLKECKGKLAAKLNALESKAKKEDRKRGTRRKIIVGGAVLAHMQKDHAFASSLRDLLARSVGRMMDREVIADLLPATPAQASNPEQRHGLCPLVVCRIRAVLIVIGSRQASCCRF